MTPIKDHADAVDYHGNRPGVEPLPVVRCHIEGMGPVLTSCWRLTWRERVRALVGGRVWVQVLGAAQPPLCLTAEAPYLTAAGTDA